MKKKFLQSFAVPYIAPFVESNKAINITDGFISELSDFLFSDSIYRLNDNDDVALIDFLSSVSEDFDLGQYLNAKDTDEDIKTFMRAWIVKSIRASTLEERQKILAFPVFADAIAQSKERELMLAEDKFVAESKFEPAEVMVAGPAIEPELLDGTDFVRARGGSPRLFAAPPAEALTEEAVHATNLIPAQYQTMLPLPRDVQTLEALTRMIIRQQMGNDIPPPLEDMFVQLVLTDLLSANPLDAPEDEDDFHMIRRL
ncbi:MAG: hypothetical protein P1U40_01995 [Coxiellaceae bacterium]|nr:hypothetical protein [Coxiellaceae bacterium]